MKNRIISALLSLVMVIGLFPISAMAADVSTLSTDINGDEIIAGEMHEFSFTLHANEVDAGTNVVGVSAFSNPEIIEVLEYYEVSNDTWISMAVDGDGAFGSSEGFAMPPITVDATSQFRVKFKEDTTPGDYSFVVKMVKVDGGETLCETDATFSVIAPAPSSLSTDIDGDVITVATWHEFNFTLHAKASDAGTNVIAISEFSNSDILEDLEYWEGDEATGEWKKLPVDGDGKFGASSGFPMPPVDIDATSKFRVMFKDDAIPGDYSFGVKMFVVEDGVLTETVLCETTATFTVEAMPSSTLSTDIDGDEIKAGEFHEFSFTLHANAIDSGKYVVGSSTFSNPEIIDILEYWEGDETTGEWKNLLVDTDGNFGDADGFQMPAIDFDATSKFRVKFKDDTAGDFSFTVQMKVMDGTTVTDEVLCETIANFSVIAHEHTFVEEWSKDDTYHWNVSTCGHDVVGNKAEHVASDWIVDVPARVGYKGSQHKECTVCGQWIVSEDIPAIPGVSNVTSVKIPVIGDTKLSISATIAGGIASMDISSSQIKKLENTETISIDLTEVRKNIRGFKLSKSTVTKLSEADIDTLMIMFKDAYVEFDIDALESLVDSARGTSITFYADESGFDEMTSKQEKLFSDMTVLEGYYVYIESASREIEEIDGQINVYIPKIKDKKVTNIYAWYVSDDAKLEELTIKDADDMLVFTTNKLSDFAITYDEKAKEDTAEKIECTKDKDCPIHKFEDVLIDAWYHDGLHYIVENKIMNGYSDTMFGPNDSITRGQIVTVLYRMENQPAVNFNMTFKDVTSDKYYSEGVKWAQATGIVAGYNADTFGPDDAITREQLATILYRYAQYKKYDVSVGEETNILSFNDAFDISEYAIPAMQWACGEGLIVGAGNSLMPFGNATRAQVATILYRFCQSYCN